MAVRQYSDPITSMLLQMRQSMDQDSERRRAAYAQAVNDVTRGMRDAEAQRARKEALALTGAEGQAYDRAHPLAQGEQAPGVAGPQIDPNKLTPGEDEAVSAELGLLTDDESADQIMNNEREAVDEEAQNQRADAEGAKTKNAVDAAAANQELERASGRAREDVDRTDLLQRVLAPYPTLRGSGGAPPEQLPPNPYTQDRDGIVTTSEMQIMPQSSISPNTWSPEKRAMMMQLEQAAQNPYGGGAPGGMPAGGAPGGHPLAGAAVTDQERARLQAALMQPTAMSAPPVAPGMMPPTGGPSPQMRAMGGVAFSPLEQYLMQQQGVR